MPTFLHEDESLLAVSKPAGINSHRPDPFEPEGLHEFLRRRLRLPHLSLLHRLDKETSGVMLFGKSPEADAALTAQFAEGRVRKTYFFVSASRTPQDQWTVSTPVRGQNAETAFTFERAVTTGFLYRAQPRTGRTHQIRLHAAESGCPVAGDTEHGPGAPAPRLLLHAAVLEILHPHTGQPLRLEVPLPGSFLSPSAGAVAREFAETVFDGEQTGIFRLRLPQAADVDLYGSLALILAAEEGGDTGDLTEALQAFAPESVYLKKTLKSARGESASPVLLSGVPVSGKKTIRENGVSYGISMESGYSTGIFADQRENRLDLRRWCEARPPGCEILNTFAYTCAFSVCAALGGARATSLDLSKSFLEWGRDNFRLNGLDPDAHDFIFGDAFEWMTRLHKKGRTFDAVLLDPPTFSTAKNGRVFKADKNYGELAGLALRLLPRHGGLLFASTNMATLPAADFRRILHRTIQETGRRITSERFQTQPWDFCVPGKKPYLKTFWFEVA
ncbi:MAG: class I SAM-dependent methyltransferase [Verrucomicrobiae bacterium]|nr:class I SAM-dependent methyltransferase [Verrucomicrobiae bacterium]